MLIKFYMDLKNWKTIIMWNFPIVSLLRMSLGHHIYTFNKHASKIHGRIHSLVSYLQALHLHFVNKLIN
jgi:hypothetical protein